MSNSTGSASNEVTILTVARTAGVSIATVSRVLNKTKAVQPETERRVMEAARQLGYSPNAQAKAMRLGPVSSIALLLTPDIVEIDDANHISVISSAVMGVGAAEGCAILVEVLCKDADGELQIPRVVTEQRVGGLMVLGHMSETQHANIVSWGLPTTVFGHHRWMDEDAHWVHGDCYEGSLAIMHRLAALGHRRVALVLGDAGYPANTQKQQAYEDGVKCCNLHRDRYLIVEIPHDRQHFSGAYDATRHLLGMKRPPTAICYATDWMALGGLRAADLAAMDVPASLSLAAFGDSFVARQATPSITAVHADPQRIAIAAVRQVLQRIRGELDVRGQIFVKSQMIERESIGPAPSAPS